MEFSKKRAPLNRTLTLAASERAALATTFLRQPLFHNASKLTNEIILGDAMRICLELPKAYVDLLILDPPYNLTKKFGGETFREMSLPEYEVWFGSWFVRWLSVLKSTASLYVWGDWKSSTALHRVLDRHAFVRNRITWEREKGRGAKTNWKNAREDIWFCTASNDYYFNVEAVKLKPHVIAPYKENGRPKDWHPSNLWTEITVPFWSVPENTDHPTQKPEKLVAKLILANSRAAAARKLGRNFLRIELDETFACLAAKRVALADNYKMIQGHCDGAFWQRNTRAPQEGGRENRK